MTAVRSAEDVYDRQGQADYRGPVQSNRNDTQASGPTPAALDPIDTLAREAETDLGDSFAGLSEQVGALEDIASRKGEGKAVKEAEQRAKLGSKVDKETLERQTRGFDLSARQKAGAKKRIGLTRAISRASAAGATRRGFAERSKGVKRVGGAFADALFGQRLGVNVDEANIFGQKAAAEAQRKANKKSSTISTIGTLVGIGLSIFGSSEKIKDDLGHEGSLLDKLKKVRVNRWNYHGDEAQHIGPFSEEFNDTFGVGKEHRGAISVIDALGVTLGAVKELNEKVDRRG